MKISSLTNGNLINIELDTKTKTETLKAMIKMLKDNGNITSEADFEKDVLEREAEGTTGIGMGLAIPHGKSSAVVKECFAIGKIKNPVDWESLDGLPVTFVVMLAIPREKASTIHLKILSKLSYMLVDDEFRNLLMNSESKKEMIDLITEKEGE